MPLILGTNSIKDTGYDVANSLRFNSGSSDYLTRTPSSATNQDLWSLSFWIKRSNLGSYQSIYGVYANSTNQETLAFDDSDRLYWQLYQSSAVKGQLTTNRVFRDVSAFYNILIVYDSANGTAGNRMRMYINGVEETSFATDTNPSSGQDSQWNSTTAHTIGRINTANYMNGYMSELVAVDGTALSPTDVGEFDEDTGIWKPIDVSGLTFGTNGFYLDFEDSSALGNDVSGNNNDFTVNNLTAIDQSTDTCTNNFATLNPLDKPGTGNLPGFAEGNLHYNKTATGSGNNSQANSTIAVNTGKWFFEIKALDSNAIIVGIDNADNPTYDSHGNSINSSDGGIAYYNNGQKIVYGTASSYGASWTTNDIIGIAINLDDNEITFYKNGSSQGAISITTTGINYRPAIMNNGYNSTSSAYMNFGNPPFSISSGNSDGNGYGNFEYSVPSGYYSLNTKNLAEYG
jgi:hypothetical protein